MADPNDVRAILKLVAESGGGHILYGGRRYDIPASPAKPRKGKSKKVES